MTTLRTLKKLVLGETWLLPLGVAIVLAAGAWMFKPALGDAWESAGGFVLLAGMVAVLLAAAARGTRPR